MENVYILCDEESIMQNKFMFYTSLINVFKKLFIINNIISLAFISLIISISLLISIISLCCNNFRQHRHLENILELDSQHQNHAYATDCESNF